MKLKFILLLLFFFALNFQVASAFPTITSVNPVIKEIMEQVNIDTLEYYIRSLQDIGPRAADGTGKYGPNYHYFLNNLAAVEWIYQQYEKMSNLEYYYNHFIPRELCNPENI